MTLSQYIRENTNDGHNIARVLIDVMEGRLDGARISHRLTAARLLTIYGHKDAADFIADNTPDVPDEEWGERVRVTIDPAISSYIKQRTDGGREICLFLIEVVQGKVEGIHVGHRVWAAKELLNRAYGKSQSRPLPKPPGSKTPRALDQRDAQEASADSRGCRLRGPGRRTPGRQQGCPTLRYGSGPVRTHSPAVRVGTCARSS